GTVSPFWAPMSPRSAWLDHRLGLPRGPMGRRDGALTVPLCRQFLAQPSGFACSRQRFSFWAPMSRLAPSSSYSTYLGREGAWTALLSKGGRGIRVCVVNVFLPSSASRDLRPRDARRR